MWTCRLMMLVLTLRRRGAGLHLRWRSARTGGRGRWQTMLLPRQLMQRTEHCGQKRPGEGAGSRRSPQGGRGYKVGGMNATHQTTHGTAGCNHVDAVLTLCDRHVQESTCYCTENSQNTCEETCMALLQEVRRHHCLSVLLSAGTFARNEAHASPGRTSEARATIDERR